MFWDPVPAKRRTLCSISWSRSETGLLSNSQIIWHNGASFLGGVRVLNPHLISETA